MEEVEDHWRDKGFVRVISVLDMIVSVLLLIFNLSRLFVLDPTLEFPIVAGFVSILISIVFWVFVFSVNILQMYVAYMQFRQVNQPEPEVQPALLASQRWLLLSSFLLGKIFAKFFIFFLMVDNHPGQTFGWLLIVGELFIRVIGLYIVREFIDDLKTTLKPVVTALNPVPSKV